MQSETFIANNITIQTELFEVKLAETISEIEEALRLRFRVFNLEMQEGLRSSYETGLDSDVYDTFCDHLIVKERATQNIIGTYRLLLKSKAERGFGFYSENEFNLSCFTSVQEEILELGRSCVEKDFRSLAVINLLWRAITQYSEMHNVKYLFGCASLHTCNINEIAAAYYYCKKHHAASDAFTVHPVEKCRMQLPEQTEIDIDDEATFRNLPPLMKGYLRLGAQICGEPAFDADFNTTDFFILVDSKKISERYKSHFVTPK